LNPEYLRNFLVVANHMNFTKASQKLFIVQSTLTRQMQSLEQQIGTKLFTKDSSLKLTEAGQLLAAEGEKLLIQMELLEQRVRKVGEMQHLTMVSLPLHLSCFLDIYMSYCKINPQANFTITYREIGEIVPYVECGRADMGLTYSFELEDLESISDEIETTVLKHDHKCVIVNNNHPFAAKGRCSIEELRKENVLYFDNLGYRHVLRDNLHAKLKPVDQSFGLLKNRETLLLQICTGRGIALLPYEEAKMLRADLTIVEIKDFTMELDIILVWKKENRNKLFWLFREYIDRVQRQTDFSDSMDTGANMLAQKGTI